jgi:hypothetical protein
VFKAGQTQGEGSIVFGVSTKLEPFLLTHLVSLKIVKEGIKLRKLWPFKVERVSNSRKKKQTTKCYKGKFPNTKKVPCMLFYYY